MLPDAFETARLRLRPVSAGDADAVFEAYAQDAAVARYTIWRPHRSRDETLAFIEHCLATPEAVERTYLLVGHADGLVRGSFALRRRAPHRLDCGYVLGRAWWRQGLMSEALGEVAAWAMRQPAVFRLGAVCDIENVASAGVLEKSGFQREGVLRRWLVHPNLGDQPRDCYSYGRFR